MVGYLIYMTLAICLLAIVFAATEHLTEWMMMRDEQWIRQSGKGFHVINCCFYCRTSFSFGHLGRFSQLIWNSVVALCTGCCHGLLLEEELGGRWAAKVWCLRNQLISCKGIKWIAHAATSTKRWEDLFHFQLSGGSRRRLHWGDLSSVVVNTWKFSSGGIKKENKTKNEITKQL